MTSRVHQIEGQYCSSQQANTVRGTQRGFHSRKSQFYPQLEDAYLADSDIQSFIIALFDIKDFFFFPEEGSQILSLITYPTLEIKNRGRDLCMAPKNKSNQ